MKTALSLSLALLALAPARAQVFRPEAVNGAVLGGIAGAVIGNNSGSHNTWKGAAIGAAAGLLVGEAVGSANAATAAAPADSRPGVVRRPAGPTGVVSIGVGYGHPGYGHGYGHGWRNHGYGYASFYYPGYSDVAYDPYYDNAGVYTRSAAADGLFWGGLAGAVIGRNSGSLGHDAWRGAAWGAGLGWLLGTVADMRRTTVVERPVAQPVVVPAAAPAPAAAPVTIINNYYAAPTSMSSANGLFGR
jgi:hypothetical protein